jgi:hypothetical protein
MSARITTPRYEIKIPLPASILADLRMTIRLHPAHWRVTYPPRQVNNLYFDTPDYRNLGASLEGQGERVKVRLRWYGPHVSRPGAAQLEVKRKAGSVGWKEIYAVDGTFDLRAASWPALRRALKGAVEPRARLWLERSGEPALINHYQRAYYATPDDTVRLTLDTALRAYDQPRSFAVNLDAPAVTAANVVLELKAGREDVARLTRILGRFGPRVDRFSKYVQGMLGGPAPYWTAS